MFDSNNCRFLEDSWMVFRLFFFLITLRCHGLIRRVKKCTELFCLRMFSFIHRRQARLVTVAPCLWVARLTRCRCIFLIAVVLSREMSLAYSREMLQHVWVLRYFPAKCRGARNLLLHFPAKCHWCPNAESTWHRACHTARSPLPRKWHTA